MASLSGATIATTFKSLLKLAGNTDDLVAGASGNGKQVMTGDGENTPIYLNTDRVGIGTATPDSLLEIVAKAVGSATECKLNIKAVSASSGYAANTAKIQLYAGNPAIADDITIAGSIYSTMTANGYNYVRTTITSPDGSGNPVNVLNVINGKVGIGVVAPDNLLHVAANVATDYALKVHNDGDNANRYGIRIQVGTYNASGTNKAIEFEDGDAGSQGDITFSGGTVAYGAFTANHDVKLPSADNSSGYAYGTLVQINSVYYKQKNGEDTERGILYDVQKTTGSYAKNVLGAYANKRTDEDNLHQVCVLGDGHILCNGETGNMSIGDGICSSSVDGQGMKADKSCMIMGIAQKDITFTGSESKLVPVQYQLTQWTPEAEDVANKAKIVALEAKDTEYATTIAALTARITALENA